MSKLLYEQQVLFDKASELLWQRACDTLSEMTTLIHQRMTPEDIRKAITLLRDLTNSMSDYGVEVSENDGERQVM